MTADITFQYPPDLFDLLVDVIPRLSRSKEGVALFFEGAGVRGEALRKAKEQIAQDRESIKKHAIARSVITELNRRGEPALRERREVLRRVIEFESFDSCWPNDVHVAKSLVGEIKKLRNVKDSFTRMAMERDAEAAANRQKRDAEIEQKRAFAAKVEKIKSDLYALFSRSDAQGRGKDLEKVLNDLFAAFGFGISEAFAVKGENGEGVVEQVDGAVELDGHIYLVEMKWLKKPADVNDVSRHCMRLFSRSDCRGLFISYSQYTAAAISTAKDALQHRIYILSGLEEIIRVLEQQGCLKSWLSEKVKCAVLNKTPYVNLSHTSD